MSSFQLYFRLGVQHILDIQGYDHILFVLALCAVFIPRDWKKIIILVTAFTIGHSLTLALATFRVIQVNTDLIEFLIPVTIAITAFISILRPKPASGSGVTINYIFALFFGLIHGLGFSFFFKAMCGSSGEWVKMLIGFNVGLEVAQLVIVAGALAAGYIVMEGLHLSKAVWNRIISGIIAGFAVYLLVIKMIG